MRYIGVSDTPAWNVAEANVTARFRGWSAFIGLQIEYSLLERCVEQELVPMARELGLGSTPWSPLKGGALSGKYTRENAGRVKADRTFLVANALNESPTNSRSGRGTKRSGWLPEQELNNSAVS